MQKKVNLAHMLKGYRTKYSLLQRDVCELTNIARSKLSAYENGHMLPSGKSINKLINLYELTEDETNDLLNTWELELLMKPKAISHMGEHRKSMDEMKKYLECG